MPPEPQHNIVIPASHPWAQYWIARAMHLIATNGAKWRAKR